MPVKSVLMGFSGKSVGIYPVESLDFGRLNSSWGKEKSIDMS